MNGQGCGRQLMERIFELLRQAEASQEEIDRVMENGGQTDLLPPASVRDPCQRSGQPR